MTVLVLFIFTSLLIPPPEHVDARARSYPLVCRGGDAMQGHLMEHSMQLRFVGAKQGADARAPQPGECAWLDRGFIPGEPQVFVWDPGGRKHLRVEFDARFITKIITGNPKYNFLANSIIQGDLFQVYAYRGQCPGTRCNFLTVTGVSLIRPE